MEDVTTINLSQEDLVNLANGEVKLLSIDADLTLFRVHTGGKAAHLTLICSFLSWH